MRVDCSRCGHHEDDTYEFDLPYKDATPIEGFEPGKCPNCEAPVEMDLSRTPEVPDRC